MSRAAALHELVSEIQETDVEFAISNGFPLDWRKRMITDRKMRANLYRVLTQKTKPTTHFSGRQEGGFANNSRHVHTNRRH